MANRSIPQVASGAQDVDFLGPQRWQRELDAWILRGLLGPNSKSVYHFAGFECLASTSLTLSVSDGMAVTPLTPEDGTAYGSLPASNYEMCIAAVNTTTFTQLLAPPANAGLEVQYGVFITFATIDTVPRVLYYRDPASTQSDLRVFRGVNNNGLPVNTQRNDTATITCIRGAEAATGASIAPLPPAGTETLYNVTLHTGDTTIAAGAISQVGNFIAGLLSSHHNGQPGQAPKIQIGTEIAASDSYGAIAAVQSYGGNPNGAVAGAQGAPGGLPPSLVWDTQTKHIWVCVATGSAATAVWQEQASEADVVAAIATSEAYTDAGVATAIATSEAFTNTNAALLSEFDFSTAGHVGFPVNAANQFQIRFGTITVPGDSAQHSFMYNQPFANGCFLVTGNYQAATPPANGAVGFQASGTSPKSQFIATNTASGPGNGCHFIALGY